MDDFNCAPILLIGFNRPRFMAEQIAALRPAHPSRLYLAVDGPRKNRPEEISLCAQVQQCANYIDWPCDVKTLFREENLGCGLGVSGAISWFFEHEESGIVLEDDCRPSPKFFRFASEMLLRYADDDRIGAVNGFNFFNLQSNERDSYHFSRHMDVWGWASWRRSWQRYDLRLAPYRDRIDSIIENSSMTPYTKKVVKDSALKSIEQLSTWDFQFFITSLANNWLNIVPRERLIVNVGQNDQNAVHTAGYNYYAREFAMSGNIDFPIKHPSAVVCDEDADRRRERMESAFFPRLVTWMGAKCPIAGPGLDFTGDALFRIFPGLREWTI